jgi:hypothetical protein
MKISCYCKEYVPLKYDFLMKFKIHSRKILESSGSKETENVLVGKKISLKSCWRVP